MVVLWETLVLAYVYLLSSHKEGVLAIGVYFP